MDIIKKIEGVLEEASNKEYDEILDWFNKMRGDNRRKARAWLQNKLKDFSNDDMKALIKYAKTKTTASGIGMGLLKLRDDA